MTRSTAQHQNPPANQSNVRATKQQPVMSLTAPVEELRQVQDWAILVGAVQHSDPAKQATPAGCPVQPHLVLLGGVELLALPAPPQAKGCPDVL